MKIKISVLLAIVVLASCSSPKYAYYFDHQNYNASKSQAPVKETSVLRVDPQVMMASTAVQPVMLPETSIEPAVNPEVKKTYLQMNKSERKAIRHQIKKDIKTYVASRKKSDTSQATHASGMDNDLKLTLIFAAIGVVAFLIGGNVFQVIGGIAFIIAVVFFVKWIIRQ